VVADHVRMPLVFAVTVFFVQIATKVIGEIDAAEKGLLVFDEKTIRLQQIGLLTGASARTAHPAFLRGRFPDVDVSFDFGTGEEEWLAQMFRVCPIVETRGAREPPVANSHSQSMQGLD